MTHRSPLLFIALFLSLLALSVPAIAEEEADESIPKIAHFHLSGAMVETPREDPFGFTNQQVLSLKQTLDRLKKAREDEEIRAVALTLGMASMGFAQMEEIRDALTRVREAGKEIFVHVDYLDTRSYALLAPVAELSVTPTGPVMLTGLFGQSLYLKNTLDKIGVEADMIHMGDYKSAAETFSATGPSPQAEENMNWLLDGLYDHLVKSMAAGRDLSEEEIRASIDGGPYSAEEALEKGLVSSVSFRDEFLENLKEKMGAKVEFNNRYGEEFEDIDASNPFAFFQVFSKMAKKQRKSKDDAVAVVYVEGPIVPGHGQPSPFAPTSGIAYSGDLRKAFEEVLDDDSLKAAVVRVSSPGGSALASEIILHAIERLGAEKPVVVSMGDMAASGGYYVACKAKKIFADETTLTGSIGVVGGKFVTRGMWDWMGVDWKSYKRGANSDLFDSLDPWGEAQRQVIVDMMEEIYGIFKGHVVEGRGEALQKPIDDIAGGRVYTGLQAKELGLVDEIGGLEDAITAAAELAEIEDYKVRVVPTPVNPLAIWMQDMTGEGERPTDLSVALKSGLPGLNASPLDLAMPALKRFEPARARALEIAIKRLELLASENVVLMPAEDFLIY